MQRATQRPLKPNLSKNRKVDAYKRGRCRCRQARADAGVRVRQCKCKHAGARRSVAGGQAQVGRGRWAGRCSSDACRHAGMQQSSDGAVALLQAGCSSICCWLHCMLAAALDSLSCGAMRYSPPGSGVAVQLPRRVRAYAGMQEGCFCWLTQLCCAAAAAADRPTRSCIRARHADGLLILPLLHACTQAGRLARRPGAPWGHRWYRWCLHGGSRGALEGCP